jgi:hypothetical protein
MKKLLMAVSIALFTMVSCSDDDNNTEQPVANETILLKKTITSTTNTQQGVRVARYYYNEGNKLTRIAYSNGTSEVVTYEGDYIVQWDKFTANTLTQHTVYDYNDNGQLAAMTTVTNNNVTTTYNYTYNADQTISFSKESTNTTAIENGTYHYSKLILPDGAGGTYGDVNDIDDKNNPLKNVAGLHRIYFTFPGNRINFINNVTAVHRIQNDLYVDTTSRTTYVYDENDFPVASERTPGYTITTQYFYE